MSAASKGRPDRRTKTPGVYQRGDGTFSVRYRDSQGRQRRATVATEEDGAVLKAEAARDAKQKRTMRRPDVTATVWQYAQDVLANYTGITGEAREVTVQEYRAILTRHLAGSSLGRRRIVTVEPHHVEDFFAEVRRSKREKVKQPDGRIVLVPGTYANATLRHLMSALRAVFRDAVRQGHFKANPCDSVAIGKPKSRPANRTYTDEVIKAILAAFKRPEAQLAAEVMSVTGMRISEVAGLNQSDLVPVANGSMGVRVERRVRGSQIGLTKTEDALRPIPLPRALAERLREHIEHSPHRGPDEPLFRGVRGGRMTPAVLRSEFRTAVQLASAGMDRPDLAGAIESAIPHGFRHSAARRWRLADIPLDEISRMLGHAEVATTMKFYGRVLDEDLPDGDLLAF